MFGINILNPNIYGYWVTPELIKIEWILGILPTITDRMLTHFFSAFTLFCVRLDWGKLGRESFFSRLLGSTLHSESAKNEGTRSINKKGFIRIG